jgi:hypothetical protein
MKDFGIMRSLTSMRSIIALALLSTTGCDATDPFLREGAWNPRGSNAANLAAMVEDPMDLVHGRRNDDRASGQLAGAAIARLRHDQVKSLPSLDTSQITSGAGSSSGGGGQQAGPSGQAEAQ